MYLGAADYTASLTRMCCRPGATQRARQVADAARQRRWWRTVVIIVIALVLVLDLIVLVLVIVFVLVIVVLVGRVSAWRARAWCARAQRHQRGDA